MKILMLWIVTTAHPRHTPIHCKALWPASECPSFEPIPAPGSLCWKPRPYCDAADAVRAEPRACSGLRAG